MKFEPELTPKQVIQAGTFGGIYFDTNFPGINWQDYPADWFEGLLPFQFRGHTYNKAVNKYDIKAGMDQAFWEDKGWMRSSAPRGWFQWYCNYFLGIRTEDDLRQVNRFYAFQRFVGQYKNTHSPRIAQSMLHWAYNPDNY